MPFPLLLFATTRVLIPANSDSLSNGYGFPSSHSQYMAYFSSFLIMHLFFRHRFISCGYRFLDALWRLVIYLGLIAWAGVVCYSRYATPSIRFIAMPVSDKRFQIALNIPHYGSGSMGSSRRCLVRHHYLYHLRTHTLSSSAFPSRPTTDKTSLPPFGYLATSERRLGDMG